MQGRVYRQRVFSLVLGLTFLSTIAWGDIPRATTSKTWVVGGYIHTRPDQKAYVTVKGKEIVDISSKRPAASSGVLLIDTNDYIFPGLVDLHGHMKYHVLPLWSLAKGQFNNRFEWRKKFSPYKAAVSAAMRPLKKDGVCAAVRWAELKALTGGVTTMQGVGGDSACAGEYAVHNVEIAGEFGDKRKPRVGNDIVDPAKLGKTFHKRIRKHLNKDGGDYVYNEASYNQAFKAFMDDELETGTSINHWVQYFREKEPTVGSGLYLTLGDDFGLDQTTSKGAFDSARGDIEKNLKNWLGSRAKQKNIDDAISKIARWIFGDSKSKGYLDLTDPSERTTKKALDYMGKGGVYFIPGDVKSYIGMYESSRRGHMAYFKGKKSDAVDPVLIAHLSEGKADDDYNRTEFSLANLLGYAKPGLVLIHAVGLSSREMRYAGDNHISFVWSPFSNLLLYGETLDVMGAVKNGVNVSIGSDWSPTGSKNLLDEMKIARRYLRYRRVPNREDGGISDRDIVKMATINGAKALRLNRDENGIGSVKEGRYADLLVVKKKGKDPYTSLLESDQSDVNLVAVAGQPLYGEPSHIEKVSEFFGDSSESHLLPLRKTQACKFQKRIRLPFFSGKDKPRAGNLWYPKELDELLQSRLAELDPIYTCEEKSGSEYRVRFDTFVEEELQDLRRKYESSPGALAEARGNSLAKGPYNPYTNKVGKK